MKITCYGSGDFLANGDLHSCFAIQGERTRILMDAGSPRITAAENVEVDAVLLSHSHLDHVKNLYSLLFHAAAEGRTRNLPIYAPEDVDSLIHPHVIPRMPLAYTHSFMDRIPETIGDFSINAIRLAQETTPPAPVFAYRIRERETKSTLAYVTDLAYSKELEVFCAGVDVLILDASGIPPCHMTPEDAKKLVDAVQPKCLVLTHFGNKTAPEKFAEVVGHKNTVFAQAGLTIDTEKLVKQRKLTR